MVVLAKRETSHAKKQFERRISLPNWVKAEKMSKQCKDGILTVSFPRKIQETSPGGLAYSKVMDERQYHFVFDIKNIK